MTGGPLLVFVDSEASQHDLKSIRSLGDGVCPPSFSTSPRPTLTQGILLWGSKLCWTLYMQNTIHRSCCGLWCVNTPNWGSTVSFMSILSTSFYGKCCLSLPLTFTSSVFLPLSHRRGPIPGQGCNHVTCCRWIPQVQVPFRSNLASKDWSPGGSVLRKSYRLPAFRAVTQLALFHLYSSLAHHLPLLTSLLFTPPPPLPCVSFSLYLDIFHSFLLSSSPSSSPCLHPLLPLRFSSPFFLLFPIPLCRVRLAA